MPARPPREKVTTATRSPRGLLERPTLSGAPMPRTTSHSVCPSATVPEVEGGAPAAPLASALASPGAGAIPGQAPSALTRSSAVTRLSGVSGGVSIETLRMNSRPERENHCASFESRSDCRRSDVPEQPAISGASAHNASRRFRLKILRTMNSVPHPESPFGPKQLSDHHFAARPWPGASVPPETTDYH